MSICVNYVWMDENVNTRQPIPTHFFRTLQDNAEKYGNTPFQLWVEDKVAHSIYYKPPMIWSGILFKSLYEILFLPLTMLFVRKLKSLEGVEHFDRYRLKFLKF